MSNLELFDTTSGTGMPAERIAEQAWVLRGFALPNLAELLKDLKRVVGRAPFRHMVTPGGYRMSVALTNCGALGWTSDRRGYRYTDADPLTGTPWPAMPASFLQLAGAAAISAGFCEFVPDACLINRYLPGSRLSLHQDKNEHNFAAPIVSVSLGLPALFLFGGHEQHVKPARILLEHGDVAVWGGVDRLRYHGVAPLKDGIHAVIGQQRINFTFRLAG